MGKYMNAENVSHCQGFIYLIMLLLNYIQLNVASDCLRLKYIENDHIYVNEMMQLYNFTFFKFSLCCSLSWKFSFSTLLL